MSRVILSLSGGMDSTTLLGKMVHEGWEVECIGFTYGSKHNSWENAAAISISDYYKVPFTLVDISSVLSALHFKSDLLKTGGDIPEGHFESSSMSRTVIPGRNMIFASILAGAAESRGSSVVAVGIHSGDHAIYPDCRPEFYSRMGEAIAAATDGKVRFIAPFLYKDKISIIEEGLKINVPYQMTRTCYMDQMIACGRCGSCQERLAAFAANDIADPICYHSRVIFPKE